MKAVVQDGYGPFAEVLRLDDVDVPVPAKGELLIRVEAASLHPGDWMLMSGLPYAFRIGFGLRGPRRRTPGFDVSGVVEAVGEDVGEFAPGDEVFGKCSGSCAEYALASVDELAHKPARLSFEEAATLAISGTAALRAMRDVAEVRPGQTVLINGASGGVGTFAIQIAKSLGADVTAVCSGRNDELVRSLGAGHVVDYTEHDVTEGEQRFDVVLDNAGSHPMAAFRRIVTPTGTYIPNNGTRGGKWFGTLGRVLRAFVASFFIKKQGRPYISIEKKQDLLDLAELVESGAITPVIDTTFPMSQTASAIDHVGRGHASGKVVVTP